MKIDTEAIQTFKRCDGGSMVAVLIIAVLLNLTLALVYYTVNSSLKKSGDRRVNSTLLHLAEAGKEHALSTLYHEDISLSTGQRITFIPTTNYGQGTYSVSCSTSADGKNAWLWSNAQLNSESKTVEVKLAVVQGSAGFSINHAIYADGDIKMSGNGDIDGAVHANKSFTCSGNLQFSNGGKPCDIESVGNMTISGNVKCKGFLRAPKITINGNNQGPVTKSEQAVDLQPLPEIDFNQFRTIAEQNGWRKSGTHYSGNMNWNDVSGGVIWFDGDVTFSGNLSINALIISTGKITCSGNFTQHKSDEGLGGIVSTNSSVTISGSHEIEGLLYSKESTKFSGNGTLDGQLICGGDLTISGNYGTVNYQTSAFLDGEGETKYYVESWREL